MSTARGRRRDRQVLLVRHGESTWNASGRIQGQAPHPGLTLRGVHQASKCARLLAGTTASALYTSDLRRAVQTAAPIGRALGLEPVADPRLRERAFGDLQGMAVSVLDAGRSGIAQGRVADADAAPPGGESVRALYRRASSFLAGALERHGDAEGDLVLVCHGGVIRVLVAWLDGTGPDEMAWCPLGNATVTVRGLRPVPGGPGAGAAPPPSPSGPGAAGTADRATSHLTAPPKEHPCTEPH